MQTLNFITGNANKLAEVRAILGSVVDLQSQAVDVPEFQGTIEYIATEKCRLAAKAVSCSTISAAVIVSLALRHQHEEPVDV